MAWRFGQQVIDFIRGKNTKNNSSYVLVNQYPMLLTEHEQEFFLNVVKNSKNYLEFGPGGSTFLALAEPSVEKITAIESDNEWLNYLRNWEEIKENEASNRLALVHVNIGEVTDYGVPVNLEEKDKFERYSTYPFENNKKYDTVLVDGRFRVACALQAILNSDLNTKILIHDFNDRAEYHSVLKFLNIVDTMDKFALFQIKPDYSRDEAVKMYEEYKHNFD